jgi:hypothetical protein
MGRKRLNSKPLTVAERVRRHRAAKAERVKTAPPPAPDDVLPAPAAKAPEMDYGEVACEVLGIVLNNDLRPILAENNAANGLKFVLGHRVGVEQCIEAVASRLDQIAKAFGVKRIPTYQPAYVLRIDTNRILTEIAIVGGRLKLQIFRRVSGHF